MEKIRDDHLNHIFVVTDIESLIKGYILNCRCEGKSPKTIEYYEGHLKRFLWYCRQFDLPTNPTRITVYHCLPLYILPPDERKWYNDM